MDRKAFEDRAAALVGRVLRGVTYWEIEYETGEPMWRSELPPLVDGLDFGVDLLFDDGQQVALTWGSEFFSHGISIRPEATAGNDVARSWPANERWQSYVGARISDASVLWSWAEMGPPSGERIVYPQDLRLDFEPAGPVFVSALEYRDGQVLPFADNVLVVFGELVARKLKIWPPVELPDGAG